LWVIDQTDGVLRETFAGDTLPITLYVEAHGERTPTPSEIAAAKGYPAAFILEEVLYATPPQEAQGCAQRAPAYIVRAQGNEPSWSIEVTSEKMIWRQVDAPNELVIDAPQSQDSEGTVGYSGAVADHSLELFVDAQACRDSMSGAYFAYAARAVFDGKELKGCARIGE
jgi:putative lipoprotein